MSSTPYLVSARKYRPQTFDTVVGQEHITTTLKNAIRNNQLAHAFLFCGPRGVGKTTCARILAKTINCENPTPDIEACGECPSCRSFQDNASFNIFELDAASNNSVDDIRELVNGVRFAPQQGKYKIYIIDEVHMLSASAFNAFLKTLEEPPPYAIFILATTEKHKILPTILSRCQIFDFKRITTRDTVQHLEKITAKEGINAEEAALHVIAQKSEGCMRDSLSMLDRIASFTGGVISYASTMEHLAMLDADFYFSLTDALLSQDVSSALLLLDGVLAKGFEGDVIMEGMSEHLRNLLLCKDARMAKLLDVPTVHQKAYYEKAAQMPPSFILSSLNELNEAENGYKSASNKRLHVELCLIRLCYVLQAVRPEAVKKNFEQPAISSGPAPAGNMPPAAAPSPQPYAAPAMAEPPQAPAKAAQPPIIQEAEQATATAAAAPSLPPTPPPPTSNLQPQTPNVQPPTSKRISANMLKSLDAALEQQEVQTQEVKTLCQEEVDAAFEKFRAKMREGNRSVILANLGMMRLDCLPPDEIHITSPSDMVDSYAQNLRNELIDFFRAEMGVAQLRITTEVKADATSNQEQPVVFTKQELYQTMVEKNPQLAKLRDGLNLQIDF